MGELDQKPFAGAGMMLLSSENRRGGEDDEGFRVSDGLETVVVEDLGFRA
jgi:hypothetical protein